MIGKEMKNKMHIECMMTALYGEYASVRYIAEETLENWLLDRAYTKITVGGILLYIHELCIYVLAICMHVLQAIDNACVDRVGYWRYYSNRRNISE